MPQNTFKSLYIAHTEMYESPLCFWNWSAYAAIAGVLRDNCYAVEGDGRLYPNVYILLLATSSVWRKNRPIVLCQQLVENAKNTKIISGRTSIQAVLDELARTETDKKTGKITKSGSATFFAKELAAGIVGDESAVEILTDIYDYNPNAYRHSLRTGPSFTIDKVVLNMLSGTNEEMSKRFLTTTALLGGLLARTFLVVPRDSEFREARSLLKGNSEEDKLKEEMSVRSFNTIKEKLIEISNLRGEFLYTTEARETYDKWYGPFRNSYRNRNDGGGIVGRIHTNILKLAMILAANELSLEITKDHIEEAITESLTLLPNYKSFAMTIGKSGIKEAGAIVLQTLQNSRNNFVSRKDLLWDNWHNFDSETFEKLMTTFEQAGMIVMVDRPVLGYSLTDKCLEVLRDKGNT